MDADSIKVRALEPRDLALFCATLTDLFGKAVNPQRTAAFLGDPANLIVVAVDHGILCGMATATPSGRPDKPPQLSVNEGGLRSGWQGRGIGRRLMAAVLAEARVRGAAPARVETGAVNTVARPLHRGNGGAATGDLEMSGGVLDHG